LVKKSNHHIGEKMKNLIILLTSISISMAADGKIGGVTYFDFMSLDDSTAFNFQR
jgi:hypothetical protein